MTFGLYHHVHINEKYGRGIFYSVLVHTVRKVLADFAVFYWRRYCKAPCDGKFHEIEGNGKKNSSHRAKK